MEIVHDGHQQTFEAFQFDLENAHTMPQLTGWPTEERSAATRMLDILTRTQRRVDAQEGGLNELCEVLAKKYSQTCESVQSGRHGQEEQCVGLGHAEKKGSAPTRVRIAATRCDSTVG